MSRTSVLSRPTPRRVLRAALAIATALAAVTAVSSSARAATTGGGSNDFSCRPSAAHADPVVMLHGTFATYYEDLNFLQTQLVSQGYCTFSFTYGPIPGFPLVGGVQPISTSAQQVEDYIEQVRAATGAAKVDLVGHSQGGFLALYVPKIYGIIRCGGDGRRRHGCGDDACNLLCQITQRSRRSGACVAGVGMCNAGTDEDETSGQQAQLE